jgi:hypothetical protein
MWGVIMLTLLPLAFFIPFRHWAFCAAAGFGIPELVAVLRRNDAYPPLTQVIHHYSWRWVTLTAVWALGAAIYASWFLEDPPLGWIAFGAGIFGWITDHLTTTFDED